MKHDVIDAREGRLAFVKVAIGPAEALAMMAVDETAGHTERLARLREIASVVNAGGDLEAILDRVVFAVCRDSPWTRSGIMAVNRATGYSELVTRYDPDERPDPDLPRRWALATSPSRRVVETKQPIVIEDAQLDTEFSDYRADALARNYRTVVILPLGCNDAQNREMVLAVHARQRVAVTAEELDFLTTVAHLVAIAVDKAKLLQAERGIADRLKRTIEIHSSLLERVLAGSSMSVIAGIVENILADPIIIFDFTADSVHVSRSPDPRAFGDSEWADLVRGPASRMFARIIRSSEPNDFRTLRAFDLNDVGINLTGDLIVEPFIVDGETVGGLVIIPRQRSLDDLERLIAQEAKFALSAQLMRGHIEQRSEARDLSNLLEQLFAGDWSDSRQISARAARLGIPLFRPTQLLAVEPPQGAGRSTEGSAELNDAQRALARSLRQSIPDAFVAEQGSVVFVGLPAGQTGTRRSSVKLERHVLDVLRWQFGAEPTVAVGPVCASPDHYGAARDQCQRVLTLARMFGRSGILQQQDFGPFALFLSAFDGQAVQAFVDDAVGEIEAYDRSHATELLKTAAIFIDESCRYQATADALGVHVSTVRYRLKRLAELFRMDVEDPEARFRLSLALRLQSMRRSG